MKNFLEREMTRDEFLKSMWKSFFALTAFVFIGNLFGNTKIDEQQARGYGKGFYGR